MTQRTAGASADAIATYWTEPIEPSYDPLASRGEIGTSGRNAFLVELSKLVLLRSDDDETAWRVAAATLVCSGRVPGHADVGPSLERPGYSLAGVI